jgi:hypothetical protein
MAWFEENMGKLREVWFDRPGTVVQPARHALLQLARLVFIVNF